VGHIVGLYLDPPERALVLGGDEKSQIQALDRTQPLRPLRPGQIERRTHDDERHGTTTLFAALDGKAGTIVGKCMPRHRAQEFRKFLDEIERNVPTDLDMHVVMDNASSPKTKLIRSWFAKRSRWHVHFTPTSSSWVNQVERFFALLSEQQIKRGADRSVAELDAAITAYVKIIKCRAQAVPLDKIRRCHPCIHRTLLPPHTRHTRKTCIGTSESGH
jgi:transposase